MDPKRSVDPLTDQWLEREIENALAIDPSPEFLARVRTRIATEPAAATWSLTWRLAGLAASLAIVVIAILVVWERREPASIPSALPDTLVEAPGGGGPGLAESAPVVPPGLPPTTGTAPGRSQLATHATAPEVLISVEEATALRRLFDDINERRIEPSMLPTITSPGPLMPIGEIVIEPITVDPLSPVSGE